MNFRKATIYAQTDASTAKTQTIDLDLSDVISRIQVKFNSTNNGHTPTAHHTAQISKVEIVDGSDVLWSLSGSELEAKNFFDYKKEPPYFKEFRNDVENYLVLDLLFGRKLWDKELALDPKRFRNPQLKITHNKASGGSAPDAATLEVVADVFDEMAVTPMGWIMAKEFYTFTSAASNAHEYVDLPRDWPIKRMILQTKKDATWWENLVNNVKISEDNDKKIPIDIPGMDLVQYAAEEYGLVKEQFVGTAPGVSTYSWYVMPTDQNVALLSPYYDAMPIRQTSTYEAGGRIALVNTAVCTFNALAMGYVPHGCVPLDFGDQKEGMDWYDVTKKGSVKLDLYCAGSVTFNVILEQLRKY